MAMQYLEIRETMIYNENMLIIRDKLRLLTGPAFILFLLLSLFSCAWDPLESKSLVGTPNNEGAQNYEGLETRSFWASDLVKGGYYTNKAVRLAENDSCIVYGEPSANISVAAAEGIASNFAEKIDQSMKDVFGDFRENLKDRGFGRYDKLILFLLDIKDEYDPIRNSSYVAGYFNPIDMYNRAHSNEAAIIYMDVSPGNPKNDDFFNTIAHELQHLINYSIRMKQQQDGDPAKKVTPQNTWIDEGLASAAEYLYSKKHITSKIDYFNDDRENAFSRGNTFFTWDGEYEDYCTIYLFFQWLRIQAQGSPEIYKDIINSEYLDYRAVTSAAAKHINERFGDWETLLSYWFLANHVNASAGFLGYNKEFETRIRTVTGSSISLASGGGVFSYLDGTGFTLPAGVQSGPHIRYIGVTQTGELINQEGLSSSIAKGRLLTFNVNTTLSGVSETGYLTGKVEPQSGIGVPRTAAPQGPYPIDIPPAFFQGME
jgi:hypothetical protein